MRVRLPIGDTLTAADAGLHTFVNAATQRKRATQVLTVTDTQDGTLTAIDSITVVWGPCQGALTRDGG